MRLQLSNIILLFSIFLVDKSISQITTTNLPPYNNPDYLVTDILVGQGISANNVVYQGDSNQIGYFNGANSNVGLENGVVLATGDINELSGGFGGFLANNVNGDPDLLNLANVVPGLIGQNFSVSSVNDVAILEFDFIAESETITFNYVFASSEYNAWENSSYNDVFGFFISGPGIVGPYNSPVNFPGGSINIASFTSTEANSLGSDLPITISSVNSFYNDIFYVQNQNFNTVFTADGFTTVFAATADVICGETSVSYTHLTLPTIYSV